MGEQVIKQVIVALFPTVDGAQQGRQLLEAEKKAISLVNTAVIHMTACLLYTSPSPRDRTRSRMPSSA